MKSLTKLLLLTSLARSEAMTNNVKQKGGSFESELATAVVDLNANANMLQKEMEEALDDDDEFDNDEQAKKE
jgi:hypothetical protein